MADEVQYPVHDPVHKRIWLTKPELQVVDTGAFQRLRRVSQLGLADYVFPGATRSRFSHSLGALHVMGELLRAQKGALAEHLGNAAGIDWRALRFAALLHDIGHLPFSHPTELVYDEAAFDLEPWRSNWLLDRAALIPQSVGQAAHETVAQDILHDATSDVRRVLDLHLSAGTISMIGQLIRGRATQSAVATALVSSDLDADRLDFVMRDSDSAGFVYGNVDLDYLLENVEVASSDGIDVLGINARHGVGALEHYLFARSFIYSQLVNHKAVAAAELLLRATLLKTLDETAAFAQPILPANGDDVREWFRAHQYHRLTDGYVLSRLGTEVFENGSASAELCDLLERLLKRRLPKLAHSQIALRKERDPRPQSMDDLGKLVLTKSDKEDLAEEASRHGSETVEPGDFCLLERPEKIMRAYEPAEQQGELFTAPRGPMVIKENPDGTREAEPLSHQEESLLRPLEGYVRDVQYVFVFESRDVPFKRKPKTQQLRAALAARGFS
jgi:uncharacterized protein